MKLTIAAIVLSFIFANQALGENSFRMSTGVGFGVDSNPNPTFAFGVDASYFFLPNIGIGPFFNLYTGNGITTQVNCPAYPLSCYSTRYSRLATDVGGQFVLSTSEPEGFNFFLSTGMGYLHSAGGDDALTFPVGLGSYYMFPGGEGHSTGLGTTMTFEGTTREGAPFIWNWRVVSLLIQF